MNKYKDQLSNPKVSQLITPEVEELLLLLSQGFNHKTIAAHLGISESKIDKKLKELREKFDVHNSLELVLLFKKIHKSE
jgi:DNA-binding NarL/FixJ family response regulator